MSRIDQECLLGIQCNNFVMLAADQTNAHYGIIIMRNDENKLHTISEKLLVGVNGDSADTAQFAQFIAKNIMLYQLRNNYPLDVKSVVHFTRRNLADGLRSGTSFTVNLLIAGCDDNDVPELYHMDFMASCVKVPFAAHGIAGTFSMSILDRYYKPDLTEEEAYNVMKLCFEEVQLRLLINLSNFQVMSVSKKGMREWPIINSASIAAMK